MAKNLVTHHKKKKKKKKKNNARTTAFATTCSRGNDKLWVVELWTQYFYCTTHAFECEGTDVRIMVKIV